MDLAVNNNTNNLPLDGEEYDDFGNMKYQVSELDEYDYDSQDEETSDQEHENMDKDYETDDPDSDTEDQTDSLTTELLSNQLKDCSWIESTVPKSKIFEIVGGLKIKKQDYDYLPRVFYVDEEDFDIWKHLDGHNHFFYWNNGISEISRRNKSKE
ncbi:hypothetical protein BGZ76_010533, partial [Entomortierella beljakovae]